ncbi:MAG: DUF1972 domain-containing protein [Clostridiales bacterium]|nr:DUF1972 domain-containing protein [Clostridiales bacterium]
MKHIFLLGKESFNFYDPFIFSIVNSLSKKSTNPYVSYHISCFVRKKRFLPTNTNKTTFFKVHVPGLGPFSYWFYDVFSIYKTFRYIKKHHITNSTIVLFSTRSGIFLPFFTYKFKLFNTSLFVYCKKDVINGWTFLVRKLWSLSEYFCVRFSDILLSSANTLTSYLKETYKRTNPLIINLPYDLSVLDNEFHSFLSQFDIKPYDYYLVIGKFSQFGGIFNILNWFSKSNTTKKLVILCQKDSPSFKKSMSLDSSQDKRILFLNISRFEHLIYHLMKYCIALIHYSLLGINKQFLNTDLDILHLIIKSPFNRNIKLSNKLYFDEKDFLDVIKKADSLTPSKPFSKLDLDNTKVLNLVKTIENLF